MTIKYQSNLYQNHLIEESRSPHNCYELSNAQLHCEGYNQLCGDHLNIYINTCEDKITTITFTSDCCAIAKASASILTKTVQGKSKKEAHVLMNTFLGVLNGKQCEANHKGFEMFYQIEQHPSRKNCANLAWFTMMGAFELKNTVTTENE